MNVEKLISALNTVISWSYKVCKQSLDQARNYFLFIALIGNVLESLPTVYKILIIFVWLKYLCVLTTLL